MDEKNTEVKKVEEVKDYSITLDVEEKDLFKSNSQQRASAVLGLAKQSSEDRSGKRYSQFRAEFKQEFDDIFEQSLPKK